MTLRLYIFGFVAFISVAAGLKPPPNFANTRTGELEIVAPCEPGKPWTVAGERGAFFGRQNGKFEAWQWPVKILSDFRIRAELADYAVPIDVNALAASIKVTPAETVITYSHAAFTVKQHVFAAGDSNTGFGGGVFFEIDAVRPLDLTFSFTPEMLRMWPAPNFGRPNGEWIKEPWGGYYILHTDNEKFMAAIAMPRTQPGVMVPYQEHPQTFPLELKLKFDPKIDHGLVFPLLVTLTTPAKITNRIESLMAAFPQKYAATRDYYDHFFDHRLVAETPDKCVNDGLRWAEVAIDQAQVSTERGEVGLVAGYYESADSARPGYAWFFGRDTLWTTYAINSYGDFALTRRALDFLIQRQRADGKIMHEYSQAADSVDWKATPYFYASADSTPLLLMAAWNYVRTSGDLNYLKANWDAFKKAYSFMQAHEGSDGIYANGEGTGWVESWPSGMPQEEIYMAALYQQATAATGRLAEALGDAALARQASQKAAAIAEKTEAEFYDAQEAFYAFSHNSAGVLDRTATVYPAVAWWDGTFRLQRAASMLSRWASSEFSTDWGARDISDKTAFYDPISYHQGSVWPLFTGWLSLAEYRAGRPLAGYSSLLQNLNLTWAQDLGSVTELLSGEFFQPLGRSSSHQLWSSAMVISPLVRGLFGVDWNALTKQMSVAPQLPVEWERAKLLNVQMGPVTVDLEFERVASGLRVRAITKAAETLCLTSESLSSSKVCNDTPAAVHTLTLPVRPVEIGLQAMLPEPGERTRQLKALSEDWSGRSVTFAFEAQAGMSYDLPLRLNRTGISVDGARLAGGKLHLEFPADKSGYVKKTVTFNW
jgi:glycogen debranching enzyme